MATLLPNFVIGNKIGIEVKASRRISPADTRDLLALSEETKLVRKIVVSTEPRERVTDEGVTVLPEFGEWKISNEEY